MTILEDVNTQLEAADPVVQKMHDYGIIKVFDDASSTYPSIKDVHYDAAFQKLEVGDFCLWFRQVNQSIERKLVIIKSFTAKRVKVDALDDSFNWTTKKKQQIINETTVSNDNLVKVKLEDVYKGITENKPVTES